MLVCLFFPWPLFSEDELGLCLFDFTVGTPAHGEDTKAGRMRKYPCKPSSLRTWPTASLHDQFSKALLHDLQHLAVYCHMKIHPQSLSL